jgi:uncharacterized membrane protein YkoI
MQIKRRHLALGGAMAAAVAVAAAVAGGSALAGDGDDQPLTGETYDRAVAAALAHTGGGEVTETEVGDDGAAYEVEVQLADGSQVEVNLDGNFVVTGSAPDDDSNDGNEDDD